MGSAAVDYSGDIAVGFSVTDETSTNPGIRWAGRLPGDPAGELAQGEAELIAGDNPFGGFRWGDYSSLAVDPVDQCTFWYTTMYAPGSAGGDWSTRIGSFKFSELLDRTDGHPRGHGHRRHEPDRGRQGDRRSGLRDDRRVGSLHVHPSRRHVRHDRVEVRVLPRVRRGRRGHRRRRHGSGLHPGRGSADDGQRRRQGRLRRRLAALRADQDHCAGRSHLQSLHRPGHRLLQPGPGRGHHLQLRDHRGRPRLHPGRRTASVGRRDADRERGREELGADGRHPGVQRAGLHARRQRPVRELRQRLDSGQLDHREQLGGRWPSVDGLRGCGPVRSVPRQHDRRNGPVRDRQQQLRRLRHGRHQHDHGVHRPLELDGSGGSLQFRLRGLLRARSSTSTTRPTAGRTGPTSSRSRAAATAGRRSSSCRSTRRARRT